ncbi:hypothetical protein [Streptomyces sp. IBSBF 3010]|uniref:hypothetical protein n=1 Tax=Streptomyces sp. IBSBF 3010 TaxID=2903526 RepID=UPI002FDC6F26
MKPYTHQELRWKPCDTGRPGALRCTTLKVPLDDAEPGGRTIGIAVSRLRAGQGRRVSTCPPIRS